jgi:small subunit ribosomal protein S8
MDMESTTTTRSDGQTTVAEAPRGGERPPAGPRKPAVQKPKRPRGIAVSDPVADMLTRVRNGVSARHETVAMPVSRMKVEIAKILRTQGFIGGFEQSDGQLVVKLKYIGGKVPAVSGIRRISKPGLRVYARKTEMPRVLGGLGIAIVSTSAGLMTGRDAEKRGLGGEVLAYVW